MLLCHHHHHQHNTPMLQQRTFISRGYAARPLLPSTQQHSSSNSGQRAAMLLLVRAEAEGKQQSDTSPPLPAPAPPAPAPAPASSDTDASAYDRAFPKTGLFSIADPRQEVYSKAGERFDPTKKGGRFKPEFIWQTNWQEQLKRQEDLERQQEAYRRKLAAGGIDEEAAKGPGVVSFSRLGALDDISVDLTEELRKAKERKQQQEAAAAAGAAAAAQQQPAACTSSSSSSRMQAARPARQQAANTRSPSYQYKDLPTQNEARRFKRSSRAAGLGTSVSVSAVGQPSAEEAAIKAAVAAAEKARYEQLKVEFQGWTLGFGLLGGIAAYYLYGSDVAASYALGSSAGLTYLRLLSRSVDAVGEQAAAGGLNTAIGQPRLLIPVVLALTYNRWNALYAEDYGLYLNFYGMLVGFFTYKFAVIGRQGLQLLSDLSAPRQSDDSSGAGDNSAAAAADGAADDAMSLDRIFMRKVMSE